MPSLVRLLTGVVIVAGLAFAAMLALATFVHVTPRPMEQAIPASKLK